TDTSVDGSVAGSGPDEIVFAVGPGVIALGGTALPTITQTLTITGPGAARLALDGGQASRLLEIAAGVTANVSGLTLRNGRVMGGDGGAILNAGTLSISACVFSGNAVTANGGAVRNSGSLMVTGTAFSTNSAQNGGAIYSSVSLQVSNSTFEGNFTGGIAPFAGGGGAVLSAGPTTVTNSTLVANSAANGGGIVATGGALTVSNSTLTDNTAIVAGGGIRSSSVTVLLQAALVADNLHGATREDVAAAVDPTSADNVIGVDTGLSGITHGANGNQIGTAAVPLLPGLGPLQNNGGPTETRAVLALSPALDHGSAATCAAADQRGIPRPLDGDGSGGAACDVGAFEAFHVGTSGLSFFPLTPCRIADTRGPVGVAGGPALAANATRLFHAGGQCGIPITAKAVAFNLTVIAGEDGDLRLYPAGAEAPLASTLNFARGRTRANSALAPIGAEGKIALQCDMAAGSTSTAHLVLDVFGYLQ
ncbi:MAG TPA: right-handed parallel beta-helix repeat-containing protein, partial [Vicinamibacteria bacterium]